MRLCRKARFCAFLHVLRFFVRFCAFFSCQNPDLPFPCFFWNSLLSPFRSFPCFFQRFSPFFPRDFRGRLRTKNPCFFGSFPCRFPKMQGKEDQGMGCQKAQLCAILHKRAKSAFMQYPFFSWQSIGHHQVLIYDQTRAIIRSRIKSVRSAVLCWTARDSASRTTFLGHELAIHAARLSGCQTRHGTWAQQKQAKGLPSMPSQMGLCTLGSCHICSMTSHLALYLWSLVRMLTGDRPHHLIIPPEEDISIPSNRRERLS